MKKAFDYNSTNIKAVYFPNKSSPIFDSITINDCYIHSQSYIPKPCHKRHG